jgi:MOSC domain-containing protein
VTVGGPSYLPEIGSLTRVSARVAALRRYPVKSMAGEALESVVLDRRGVVGDRWLAVVDEEGRFASGKDSRRFRRRDAVFDFAAATDGGEVRVRSDGQHWTVGDPGLDRALSDAMRATVRVLPEGDVPHQDAGSVSLVGSASLQWCRDHLDVDTDFRRVRPNILVETTEPFVEESWVGSRLTVGGATLAVVERIERCRMVDLAQDGLATTTPLLKQLGAHRDLCLGVYADVLTPGRIGVGDRVRVDGTR